MARLPLPSPVQLFHAIATLSILARGQCCYKSESAPTPTPGFFQYNITAATEKDRDSGNLKLRIFFPEEYRIAEVEAAEGYKGTLGCVPLDEEGGVIRGRGQPFRNAAECALFSSEEVGVVRLGYLLSVVGVVEELEVEQVFVSAEECVFSDDCERFEPDRSGQVELGEETFIPLALFIAVPLLIIIVISAIAYLAWRRSRKGERYDPTEPGMEKHGWRGVFGKASRRGKNKTSKDDDDDGGGEGVFPDRETTRVLDGASVPPRFEEKVPGGVSQGARVGQDSASPSRASVAATGEAARRTSGSPKVQVVAPNTPNAARSQSPRFSLAQHPPYSPIPPKSEGDESMSTTLHQQAPRAPPPSQADARDVRHHLPTVATTPNSSHATSTFPKAQPTQVPPVSGMSLIDTINVETGPPITQDGADSRARSALGVVQGDKRASSRPGPASAPAVQRPRSQELASRARSGVASWLPDTSMNNPHTTSATAETLASSPSTSPPPPPLQLPNNANHSSSSPASHQTFLNAGKQERITKWTQDIARARTEQTSIPDTLGDSDDTMPLAVSRSRILAAHDGDDDDVPLGARRSDSYRDNRDAPLDLPRSESAAVVNDDDDVPLGRLV